MDLAEIKIKVDTRDLRSANDEIGALGKTGKKTEKDVNDSVGKMDKSFKGLGSTLKLVGGAFAALGVVALGKSFADTVTETERLKGSLVTVTGSTENAALAFEKLLGFASTTPFTLDQSVTAFTRLSSLGLAPSQRALESYGNTAAAMGKDMMQMIEAVADASTGEFERLKEFGIRASKQGEEVSFTFQGVTTTVAMNSEKIQEYLMGIGEVNFAGAMENQMQRLPGLLSNLSDQVTKFFLAIGDAGGISLLAGAISSLSGAMGFLTENVDFVVQAVTLLGVGLGTYFGVAAVGALVGNIGKIRTAIIAMNVAIASNPIGAIATAISVAAVAIIMNFDKIKKAAVAGALFIEKAWLKLKLFFMKIFAPVLTGIRDKFIDIKIDALATFAGITAAAKNPLSPVKSFNRALEETERELKAASRGNDVFADSIQDTENRLNALESQIDTTDTTIADMASEVVEADIALEDLTNTISEPGGTTEAVETLGDKAGDLIQSLKDQKTALNLTGVELEIYNALLKAPDATDAQKKQIIALTTEIHNNKSAIQESATALEEAEEKYEAFHSSISGFFTDLFNNGRDAFKNIGDKFEQMLKKMVADFAASKIMNLLGGLLGRFGAIGNAIANAIGVGGGTGAVTGGIFGGGGAGGIFGGGAAGAVGAGVAGAGAAGVVGVGGAAGVAGAGGGFGGGMAGATSAGGQFTGAAAGGQSGFMAGFKSAIFNPITATLAALFAAYKIFGTKSTPSFNAGFLLSSLGLPGEYSIDPFASGIQPVGFTRRAGRTESDPVIATFRELDKAIVGLYNAAGIDFRLSGSGISGYAETGLGQGLFYGAAGEEGRPGVPVDQQLARYAREMFQKGIHYGLPQNLIDRITSAGSAGAMLETAKAMISGSHRNGLSYVPYDGYIAELHKGERVMTADEARGRDNEITMKLNEVIKVLSRNGAASIDQNTEIARNTYETAKQIRDAVTFRNKASVLN